MNRAVPSLDAALSLTPERDSAEERYLFQTLAELRRAYERDRAGHEHGMAYKTLKLPADKAAWAWAEFMEPACPQP